MNIYNEREWQDYKETLLLKKEFKILIVHSENYKENLIKYVNKYRPKPIGRKIKIWKDKPGVLDHNRINAIHNPDHPTTSKEIEDSWLAHKRFIGDLK